MDILLDPNIAYLILLAGVVTAFFSASTPGTGIGELTAVFFLVLAGYAAYHLSVNWWALLLLALSIAPFIMAVRGKQSTWAPYLGAAILLVVIGSVFLFPAEEGLISVNPLLALLASGLAAVVIWYVSRKFLEISASRPAHDLDALVGQSGSARSDIHADGSVYINGELWSARSDAEIPSGSHVRVVRREGFVLVVEKE